MNFGIQIGTAKFISHNPRNIFRDADWYREIYFAQNPEMNFGIQTGTAKFISHNPPK